MIYHASFHDVLCIIQFCVGAGLVWFGLVGLDRAVPNRGVPVGDWHLEASSISPSYDMVGNLAPIVFCFSNLRQSRSIHLNISFVTIQQYQRYQRITRFVQSPMSFFGSGGTSGCHHLVRFPILVRYPAQSVLIR